MTDRTLRISARMAEEIQHWASDELSQWPRDTAYAADLENLLSQLTAEQPDPDPTDLSWAREICDDPEKLDAFMEAHPLPQHPVPDAVAEARDPASIIAAVCEEMNGNGYTSKPRIVARADFDLSKFKEQRSDFAGVETEWVDQRGPGMCGDDFYGTLAVPIDAERLFVVDYDT